MDIVEEARKVALAEIEKFGIPIMIHFEISEKKALELAERFEIDRQIVHLGVILMDLKLGQASKEGKLAEHVKMSSEAAKKFLDMFDLDEEMKKKIINCVEAHHGQVPFICKEAEICANADCYRFIHPRGFFAYLTILGRRFDNFKDCLGQTEKKMDEKHGILSLDICKKELDETYRVFKQFIRDARNFD